MDAIAEWLRPFWRGAWRELWDAARSGGARELRRPRKRPTPAQKVEKIEELIDNDELAKALKTVMQKQGPNSDANRIAELRDSFPKRSLLDNVAAPQAHWTGEFEESVEDAILELLRHLPRGSGAGPDGSIHEHWAPMLLLMSMRSTPQSACATGRRAGLLTSPMKG